MEIGISLPALVDGVDRGTLVNWARRSEAVGFASLSVLDRLVHPGFEPLITLAACATVTERIRLLSNVLIAPYRANTALLAKQAATIDAVAEGRLTLGVGVGWRKDDYDASGVPWNGRGARLDMMLAELAGIWSGAERGSAGAVGPLPARGNVPLLIGGRSEASFRRVARFGIGWTQGVGGPADLAAGATAVRRLWKQAGRAGRPRIVVLSYYALGHDARNVAGNYLRDFYAPLGEHAETIARSAVVDAATARQLRDAYAEAGADELIFVPTTAGLDQLDLLAKAVL
ncbi:LLM class oxidoreductase [Flindersiella endophytica]